VLTVVDNGPGPQASSRNDGNGLGLANIRERLTTLYGNHARLELSARPAREGGGTHAVVTIPYRPASAAISRNVDSVTGAPIPVPTPSDSR
jgi:sensor histidine kinase YesM